MSKFKVGDKVIRKTCGGTVFTEGFTYNIYRVTSNGWLILAGLVGAYGPENFLLAQPRKTTTPHKHAALIHAWADDPGLEIEFFNKINGCWEVIYGDLFWTESLQYRIKPEKSEKELERDAILEQIEDLKKKVAALEV